MLSSARAAIRAAAPKRPAAGKASSPPAATASSVPSADTASVCSVAQAVLATNGGDRSGCANSAMKRPIDRIDSRENSGAKSMLR